jgi:hypothetical protein
MFEITSPMTAKLATFAVRTEKHGDDDVLAFSMGLKIITANTFLDLLAPGLRESLFMPVEGQDQLPGVEPATPLLRCKVIDAVHLDRCFEGWTMTVLHGIDEETAIVIGGAKVDKWRVLPMEGGSVEVLCRVGSNDVDETELGKLGGKLSQEIEFTLAAPVAPEPAIDGTTEAFKRDHPESNPGQGDLLADSETQADRATDAFLGIHGGDDEGGPRDSDQESGAGDSEGGEPDLHQVLGDALGPRTELPRTVKYRSPHTGETWSGRGQQPRWIKAALAGGQSLEDFAVQTEAA